MDADSIRDRLTRIAVFTAASSGVNALGYWLGDVAEERRIEDDLGSGRADWKGAHRAAKLGVESLDAGNLKAAEEFAWIAVEYLLAALNSRIEPADLKFLSNSAARRGRPSATSDRNRRLAEAVATQEASGLRGKAAWQAAFAADRSLEDAFCGLGPEAIAKAIQRGKSR